MPKTKNEDDFLELMFSETKHKKSFSEHLCIWIINIIGVVCILSMIVFAAKLILNQNDLSTMCNSLLNNGVSKTEVEAITEYIGTIHSMITAINHNEILALVYSILSTLCLGIGLFFLKTVYSRQKEMKIKTEKMADYIDLCELINYFNTICISVYNYATLLSISIKSKISNNNEFYCRLRDAVKRCDKQLDSIFELRSEIPKTTATTLRFDSLGYANQSLKALKDSGTICKEDEKEINSFIEDIEEIMEKLRK